MAGVKKIILVTAEHHPSHKFFKQLAERLAEEFRAELEIKIEDYVFLIEHGDTDEFGMSWVPQILAELEDGRIVKVLTKPVLTSMGAIDEEGSYQAARKALEEALQQ